jgi:hypothetical protein
MKPIQLACLMYLVLVLLPAAGCTTREESVSSSESQAVSTTVLMKPTGGLGHDDTNTVGCPSGDEWPCVTDGTSFGANDGNKTYVYSTAAGGRHGTSYSGAPAGTVTRVTTNVVAAAEAGATGTVTVALYSAGKLVATGAAHPLTATYAAYPDTFAVSVESANTLQTWVTFSSAGLKYTEIWLSAAVTTSAGDGGALDAETDAATAHSVTLRWNASSTPGVTYTVLRSTTNGSGYVNQVSGLSALTWTDTAVQSSATYYYVVNDSLGSATSGDSNQATAIIP